MSTDVRGEVHEVRGMPGVFVASIEINGRFSCRPDDVSDATTREEALAWLRGELAKRGHAGAPIREGRS